MDGQVGEKGFHLSDAHLPRVAFVVEEDEAPDPLQVGFFGAVSIMLSAEDNLHLIEELLGLGGRSHRRPNKIRNR